MPLTPGTIIVFSDTGPDDDDRRHFTLYWPVEPQTEIVRGKERTRTRRAQGFFSTQWRKFLADGALEKESEVLP